MILIVDDEQDIRDSLQELFLDEGFSARTAANGVEALALLEREPLPRVVVLDLLMPRMGGIELYERMQSDARLRDIPVVISTSDPSRAPSGLLIMKKPIHLERLLDTVRRLCE